MSGPEALHARPPEMAQESTHRKFTGCRRARGCCVFRHADAWDGLQLWRRLGRSATGRVLPGAEHRPSFLLRRRTGPTHTPSPVYASRVLLLRGGLAAVSLAVRPPVFNPPRLSRPVCPSHSRRGAGRGAVGASSCSPWWRRRRAS